MFDRLSSKASFYIGLVGGILGLCTIGFVVTVILVLKGGELPFKKVSANTNPTVAPSPAPQPEPEDLSSRVAPVGKDDHIRGDKDAPVKIVEFSDLECPFCKRFHPTMKQVVDEYKGKVAWIYRHFPLDGLHSKARKEAEASECAAELGGNDKFWAYIDRVYERTPSNNGLDLTLLPQIAEDIGLNKAKFEECLSSGRTAARVAKDSADAVASGGQGTPYSVIITKDGKTYPVGGALPFESIKAAIDQLVK